LSNVGLPEGDLFIRLYMVGPDEQKARPTVMVCSVSNNLRKEAKDSLVQGGVLSEFNGFAIGSTALPLEAKSIPRRWWFGRADGVDGEPSEAGESSLSPPSSAAIFAESGEPLIGRKLLATLPGDSVPGKFTTGGAVFRIGNQTYQLTAGHLCERGRRF